MHTLRFNQEPDYSYPEEDPTGLETVLCTYAEQYDSYRFVHFPGFLHLPVAAALLEASLDVPSRRVICGDEGVSWDEQNFTSGHPAYDFFTRPGPLTLIQRLSGLPKLSGLMSWTSGYGTGEFINPHTDSAGTIQLLVCLQAPPNASHGGELIVGGQQLFLTPGDAIAFEATRLEHSTTPLVASEQEPDPRRVVLVGRYYMDE